MVLVQATIYAGVYNNDPEMFYKGKENFKKYSSLTLKELEEKVENATMVIYPESEMSRLNDIHEFNDTNYGHIQGVSTKGQA
jgi:uridylate kinase